MAHLAHLNPEGGSISRLIVTDNSHSDLTLSFVRKGGTIHKRGLRVDVSDGFAGRVASVVIGAGDLFALREYLAELPEGYFKRPADPVSVDCWSPDDVIVETGFSGDKYVWVRSPEDRWTNQRDQAWTTDGDIDTAVKHFPESFEVLVQKSGLNR